MANGTPLLFIQLLLSPWKRRMLQLTHFQGHLIFSAHPGITRMTHVVQSRNLPYAVEDVKRITNSCQICAVRFYKPTQATLVKPTQPFEKLNLDFNGPLPSKTQNKYMLTIIDEYSRFPFVIPCPDVTAITVIQGIWSLFAILGVPAYIFMSEDIKSFLLE